MRPSYAAACADVKRSRTFALVNPAFASGAALVLVGLLIGPSLGLLDPPSLRVLAPVTALGIGWIGAGFGSRLEWRVLSRIPRAAWSVAAIQAAGTFTATAAAAWLLARAFPALAAAWHGGAALLTLAAAATVSSPHAVALAAQRAGAGTRRADTLAISAMLDASLGATAFALMLALYHPRAGFPGGFGWAGWLAALVAASGAVGLLFLWLVRLARRPEVRDVELLAVILVGAGVGYAALLSPFVVCTLVSALIVNRIPSRRRQLQTLLRDWRDPMYAVLLLAAGVLLRVPTAWLAPAIVLLFGIRIAARWISARFARPLFPSARLLPQIGIGTIAQGGVALALGLSYGLVYADAGAVLATILSGVALAQAAAPWLTALAFRGVRGEVTA